MLKIPSLNKVFKKPPTSGDERRKTSFKKNKEIGSKKRKMSDTPLSPCLSKACFNFVGHVGFSFQICAATINRLGQVSLGRSG